MSRDFYIRILKAVPDRFRRDRIFESDELSDAGLKPAGYDIAPDRYHVQVKERLVYASMDDITAYLKEQLPDQNFENWAMRGGWTQYAFCYGKGWSYTIPYEVIKSLKRPHVSDQLMTICTMSWSITDYNNQWLSGKCPMYLNGKTVKSIFSWYMDYLKQNNLEDLEYMLEEPTLYADSIFRAVCEAVAYAHKTDGTGFLEWG